jgi:guanosine-3',5'-bis(diphosphate) 3'-pyrophosphohydrolase
VKQIIASAIEFAVRHHDGQFDKGGHPYILHPLKVMYKLKSDDEELNAIAVLHDVIEDSPVFKGRHDAGYYELEYIGMTRRVIEAVRLLTKAPDQDYDDYIDAICYNKDAILVKMSDLRQNMDLRRLKGVTPKDMVRMTKYANTYHRLAQALDEARFALV